MSTAHAPHGRESSHKGEGQSPDNPIEFDDDTAVGRGNEERANAEPEPPALHDAERPDDQGKGPPRR